MNVIDEGGFAVVKRARLNSTGQEFAIKMVCNTFVICIIMYHLCRGKLIKRLVLWWLIYELILLFLHCEVTDTSTYIPSIGSSTSGT